MNGMHSFGIGMMMEIVTTYNIYCEGEGGASGCRCDGDYDSAFHHGDGGG